MLVEVGCTWRVTLLAAKTDMIATRTSSLRSSNEGGMGRVDSSLQVVDDEDELYRLLVVVVWSPPRMAVIHDALHEFEVATKRCLLAAVGPRTNLLPAKARLVGATSRSAADDMMRD